MTMTLRRSRPAIRVPRSEEIEGFEYCNHGGDLESKGGGSEKLIDVSAVEILLDQRRHFKFAGVLKVLQFCVRYIKTMICCSGHSRLVNRHCGKVDRFQPSRPRKYQRYRTRGPHESQQSLNARWPPCTTLATSRMRKRAQESGK